MSKEKIEIETPEGFKWIDFQDVKNHKEFERLLMKGYSSEEAYRIIQERKPR